MSSTFRSSSKSSQRHLRQTLRSLRVLVPNDFSSSDVHNTNHDLSKDQSETSTDALLQLLEDTAAYLKYLNDSKKISQTILAYNTETTKNSKQDTLMGSPFPSGLSDVAIKEMSLLLANSSS